MKHIHTPKLQSKAQPHLIAPATTFHPSCRRIARIASPDARADTETAALPSHLSSALVPLPGGVRIYLELQSTIRYPCNHVRQVWFEIG